MSLHNYCTFSLHSWLLEYYQLHRFGKGGKAFDSECNIFKSTVTGNTDCDQYRSSQSIQFQCFPGCEVPRQQGFSLCSSLKSCVGSGGQTCLEVEDTSQLA